jgi:Tfp pilus assembly protein PilF
MKINRSMLLGVTLAIFAGTLWLYWPAVNGRFLTRMDDDEYLRQSMRWRGLSWDAVRWAFTTTEPYYHPLPRLSHALDYKIWGTNAQGHHATSVVLHALNSALVLGFLWTLLGVTAIGLTAGERLAVAAGVAVVFAIHPLQVESVAWMSGRTQLLCTAFGIGSLWAYIAGVRRWVVGVLFVVALLCKPMAVSLPFVMLALDYFPLRRYEKSGWGPLLREKAPWIGLGLVAAVATIFTESRAGGLLVPLETVGVWQRVCLTLQSLTFYPAKLLWPAWLSPYYPRPTDISLTRPAVLAAAVCVAIVALICVWRWRQTPALATGWGVYVLLVLPMSGPTQTGGQAAADRYAYAAMVPLLLLAGGASVWCWRRGPIIVRLAVIGLLVGEICFFGLRTRIQTLVWRNDESLWRGVLTQFPDSGLANEMLAEALMSENQVAEALEYARQALILAPSAESHRNLGLFLVRAGKRPEAVREFEEALRIRPEYAEAHCNLGVLLQDLGKFEDAIAHYQQALRIKPNYEDAHYDLGVALVRQGQMTEAMAQWEEALRIDPDYAEAHANLGVALEEAGKLEDAVGHYEQALRINPNLAVVHYDLGNALVRLGLVPEAVRHYHEALRLKPDYAAAQNALVRLRAVQ